MKTLLTFLLLTTNLSAADYAVYNGRTYTNRVCSNPNCQMCAQIQAQLQTPTQQTVPSTAYTSAPSQTQSTVELIPVVTRVKRCDGIRCWFENVTTWQRRTRSVQVPTVSVLQAKSINKEQSQAPSPQEAVNNLLRIVNPSKLDVIYDLGSGSGRILVTASARYGCRAVGLEIDPIMVQESKELINFYSLEDKIRVHQQDILQANLSECKIVTMYLYPELMENVISRLPKGCRVYSLLHGIVGAKEYKFKDYSIFEYIKG